MSGADLAKLLPRRHPEYAENGIFIVGLAVALMSILPLYGRLKCADRAKRRDLAGVWGLLPNLEQEVARLGEAVQQLNASLENP